MANIVGAGDYYDVQIRTRQAHPEQANHTLIIIEGQASQHSDSQNAMHRSQTTTHHGRNTEEEIRQSFDYVPDQLKPVTMLF